MIERGVQPWDIEHALVHVKACRLQRNGRWHVMGPAVDGNEIAMSVAIEEQVVVVTVVSEEDPDV